MPRIGVQAIPVRLILICHAATPASRAASFAANEPLDARAKAALSGAKAPVAGRASRLSSPMEAALETARALGLDCRVEPRLRDLDYGSWAGRPLAAIAEESPDSLARWLADPRFAAHGGESVGALFERTGNWLETCADAGTNVVAVTHGAVVRAMIATVLDAPPQAFWRIDIAPATVSELRHDGRRWALRSSGLPL